MICDHEDCERKPVRKGFCKPHYNRVLKYGSSHAGPPLHGAPQKFVEQALSQETDECIIWPFAKVDGYAVRSISGKVVRVHREVLEKSQGLAPKDKPEAAHAPLICHNRACINKRHLRWASRSENSLDAHADGTMRGKLTESEAREVKAYKGHWKDMADKFSVSKQTVVTIRNGKSWSWL